MTTPLLTQYLKALWCLSTCRNKNKPTGTFLVAIWFWARYFFCVLCSDCSIFVHGKHIFLRILLGLLSLALEIANKPREKAA